MSGRIWTENLSGWNLCTPQILSPICVLVFVLRKGDCRCQLQHWCVLGLTISCCGYTHNCSHLSWGAYSKCRLSCLGFQDIRNGPIWDKAWQGWCSAGAKKSWWTLVTACRGHSCTLLSSTASAPAAIWHFSIQCVPTAPHKDSKSVLLCWFSSQAAGWGKNGLSI